MTEHHATLTPSTQVGFTVLALVLATGTLTVALGSAAGATPPLSCADGEGGVRYTAGNLTVADASDAPVDNPFTAENAVTVGNVTFSADGPAFVRVEQVRDGVCLSDANATATPVTVETADATLTVEGQFDTFAFDDPTVGGDSLAYESERPATVTVADSGLPAGTTVEVVDSDGDATSEATVAADGSLTLSLPASDGSASLDLRESPPETTTDQGSDDDSDEPDTETTAPGDGTDGTETESEPAGDSGPGFGIATAALALLTLGFARRWAA